MLGKGPYWLKMSPDCVGFPIRHSDQSIHYRLQEAHVPPRTSQQWQSTNLQVTNSASSIHHYQKLSTLFMCHPQSQEKHLHDLSAWSWSVCCFSFKGKRTTGNIRYRFIVGMLATFLVRVLCHTQVGACLSALLSRSCHWILQSHTPSL